MEVGYAGIMIRDGKFLDEEIRGAEPISNGDTKFWENILNPVLEVLAN